MNNRCPTYCDARQADCFYDASGQRTRSEVTVGTELTTTDYVYQGLALMSLSATRGEDSWKITYLYDEYGRPYGGIYRSPNDSTAPVFFAMVVTDRGDVVELLDAAGNPFAAYRYDAWGNPQGSGTDNDGSGLWYQTTGLITSSTLAKAIAQRQPLRYASYCFDSESGMYYLSSRHYDPKTRQFLSKDLSRNDGEQSAYQYCLGNPVGNTDPTGFAVVREQDRPRTPQQRAATRNRVMEAMWQWYQNQHKAKQSTASKIVDYLSYLNPQKAVGKLVSYVTNKINKPVGVAVDLFSGEGDRERYYGASTKETQQMMQTMNVGRAWKDFQAGGYENTKFNYDTYKALDETVFGPDGNDIPFTNTPAQVGGYRNATVVNNGDETATVTILNNAGTKSFFYHMMFDMPWQTGPGATIHQTFQWTWPLEYEP